MAASLRGGEQDQKAARSGTLRAVIPLCVPHPPLEAIAATGTPIGLGHLGTSMIWGVPGTLSDPMTSATPGGVAILAWALGAYLLGSIPFGLVMARVIKGVDLREIGSGNIGATNAMRAMGRPLGVVAFLLDFLKGWLPVFLVTPIGLLIGLDAVIRPGVELAAGAAAVLGHCFPLYLRFRGGKGVSTACGALVAVDPIIFLLGGLAWTLTLFLTRYVGLASIVMGVAFPFLTYWRTGGEVAEYWVGAGLLALLIVWRHRSNMARILAGTEPRIGRKTARKTP